MVLLQIWNIQKKVNNVNKLRVRIMYRTDMYRHPDVLYGISRSSFSEIINGRGLEQLQFVFENLYKQALKVLPKEHKALGDLISIDGRLRTKNMVDFFMFFNKIGLTFFINQVKCCPCYTGQH